MVFQLKARGVTKEEEKKLCRKYSKLLKKDNNDAMRIICNLFLEIIYLYFNNQKRKLYKLFFPVIMANFIEMGSINSVIEEYRSKKKLFSESYTCRILKQLDENTGLEIGRIFRKILFKTLKRNGFKNKGFCVAIDITAKPFYGNKKLLMVKGTKRKASTNYSIQYLTASIVEEGVRFNLLCFSINGLTLIDRKVQELIREIKNLVSVKILFLDRGFGSKKYCHIIKSLNHKFVMPITRNRKLKEFEMSIIAQLQIKKDEYAITEIDYIFGEGKPKEYTEKVRLFAIYEDKHVFYFITNIWSISLRDCYLLADCYGYRFGIETNYRVDNMFSPFTSSIAASVRYLLMQISLIAQDLWTFINFLLHKKETRQPRERFKGNGSIFKIIKARIKELNFIWRPIITAVQFKRRVEGVLG
jgi:hypothetical protein